MTQLRGTTLLFSLLSALLPWDVCVGERVVHIDKGPLYRAMGYPISISCNVTGFSGPSVQMFQFSIYKPENPGSEIKIISTADPNIAYTKYQKRVSGGDIEIERLAGASVLLRIRELLEDDSGEYECFTPISDGSYLGSYSAKTTVHVIPDTLSASTNPATLSKTEGQSLQLECEVSSQTYQHTHLSVTWFLLGKDDSAPRPIISLSRDLTLDPGEGFQERYRAGSVSLDKVQDTTYRLSVSRLQLTDQGKVHCQASEWIQDADRSWYRIAYKDSEAFTLQVQPIDVVSDSFSAGIEAPEGELREGDALEIQCSIEAQNIQEGYFSVAWLKNDKEVAGFGPTGIPSVGPDYSSREREGAVKMVKKSDKDYLLAVRPVRTEDAGKYLCRVWREEKTAGSFSRGQSQDSGAKHVAVTAIERKLAVTTLHSTLKVNEGDVLRLTCGVSGSSGQLSVTWQHRVGHGDFGDVISLSRYGVMEAGVQYRQRTVGGDVRALRTTPESFTLEIANALPTDNGTYKCTVSEWGPEAMGGGEVDKNSQEVNTEVLSLDSLMHAQLKSRTVRVRENEEIELFCKVKGPRFPLSVTWNFKHSASAAREEIVSLSHDGGISWRKTRRNYQLRTEVQPDEVSFVLKVFGASSQEGGKYQCVVDAFLRQTRRASKSSNEVAVQVLKPNSRLSISVGPRSLLQQSAGSDVQLECTVLAATTANASRFAVSWVFRPEGGQNRTLLSADRDSVLEAEAGQRYSLIRRKARSYELLLRQAGPGDSGSYYCRVEEWLQDPHGAWGPLASTSAVIQLLVSPRESNFSVTKGKSKVTVHESHQVDLRCTLGPGSLTPTSHYAITWSFVPANSSEKVMLMQFSHDGLLDYRGVNAELMKRMVFSRPSQGSFGLSIQNMDAGDSGRYSCQVDEYQLDCEGKWQQRATDRSGVTSVNVLQTESNLHVQKDNVNVTMGNQQGSFTINCNITSYSSAASVFEVTWWRRPGYGAEEPHPIFRAARNFTLQHLDKSRKRLLFGRPRATLYTLTVPDAQPSDGGQYYCRVEEWLLSPRNSWRKIAEDTSGYLNVLFQAQAGSNFSVQKLDIDLSIQEGDMVDLRCTLGPGSLTPTSHYAITWSFVPANSSEKVMLMQFSHDGLLDYRGVNAELMKRMVFSRPSRGSFGLSIQNMDAGDSGRYSCQVDEYQLDCKGKWQQRATDRSGVTSVNVRQTESTLHVLKHDDNVTVSDQQDSFVIVCNITSYSSAASVFEVTWWCRQADGKGESRPIFRARRNFTLEHLDKKKDGLLFGRPRATLYTLTVPDAQSSDGGQYYCRVEEWLLSPRNSWRKIAEDTSGYLNVSFQEQGSVRVLEAACAYGPIPIVLSLLIALLVLVVGALSYKLWKAGGRSAKRKSDDSFWESNPLKPKP
ncbi:hypothetical protein COCON_G00196650 [Conger conger]|uniref:Ig-like domain-containing protein n=1 Tax=Conger conger TaxID=82655 RepID=A0A9Q1D0X8_CONCO|nr:hypothetical protein COCON_G00196650 [Conger conger]